MKAAFRRVLIQLVMIVASLGLTGCATGVKFSAVERIPEGKALIYVYRMGHLGGIASVHRIYANGEPAAALPNESYYPFITTPGEKVFSSKSRSHDVFIDMAASKRNLLTLDVRAGETYFLEFHIGDTWGPKLYLVEPETGWKRIQKCRLAKKIVTKD